LLSSSGCPRLGSHFRLLRPSLPSSRSLHRLFVLLKIMVSFFSLLLGRQWKLLNLFFPPQPRLLHTPFFEEDPTPPRPEKGPSLLCSFGFLARRYGRLFFSLMAWGLFFFYFPLHFVPQLFNLDKVGLIYPPLFGHFFRALGPQASLRNNRPLPNPEPA